MVLGCGLPLLLIFLAPSIGIGGGTWLFAFIIIMFAVHLLMPMRHGSHTHGLSNENLKKKDKKKEIIITKV
tara:strand:+ start:308 stop:520 length:213 start_codon:yes stop_codon:yes gene_type:complete